MIYHSKNVDNIKDLAVTILSEMFNAKKNQILDMKSRKRNIIQAKRFLIFILLDGLGFPIFACAHV